MSKNTSLNLVRYTPTTSNEQTAQLIECYREVFATKPWSEWMTCPVCKKSWGKEESSLLAAASFRHCGEPVVDFWPRDQVAEDLKKEITPQSSCWLAIDQGKVIGFCWGYPISLRKLEEKLGVSLNGPLAQGKDRLIAYQDEVGVCEAYRGQKIAKTLVKRRLQDFLCQGLDLGIVRTRRAPTPSQTYLWYTQKLGYEIMAVYPGQDGRVVLGRRFAGLSYKL